MTDILVEVIEEAAPVVQIIEEAELEIVEIIEENETEVVEVIIPGPQGPAGPAGSGGSIYLHTQLSASALWTIPHNLGRRPVISVRNTGGEEIVGNITHLSVNTLTVEFVVAVSGTAYLV